MPFDPSPAGAFLAASGAAAAAGIGWAPAAGRLAIPRPLLWLPGMVSGLCLAGAAARVTGTGAEATLLTPLRLGASATEFALSSLAAPFALVAGILIAIAAAAGAAGSGSGSRPGPAAAAFHLAALAAVLVSCARDPAGHVLGWSLAILAGWAGIACGAARDDAERDDDARRWLLAGLAGAGLLAVARSLIQAAPPQGTGPAAAAVVLACLTGAFACLGGLAPAASALIPGWAAAAPPLAAVIGGAFPALAVLELMRGWFLLGSGPGATWAVVLLVLAVATALHVLLLALVERDLRRIAGALGVATGAVAPVALAVGAAAHANGAGDVATRAVSAAIFAALAGALVRAALQLTAGGLAEAAGSSELGALAAARSRRPLDLAGFVVAAMSGSFLPPAVGFVGLLLAVHSLLSGLHLAPGAVRLAALAATVGLAVAAALAPIAALRALAALLGSPPGRVGPAAPLRALPGAVAALAVLAAAAAAGPSLRALGELPAPLTGQPVAASFPAPAGPAAGAAAASGAPALGAGVLIAVLGGAWGLVFAALRLAARRPGAAEPPPPAAAPPFSAAGFAQPFTCVLPEVFGTREEATILEGESARFPTRVAFHHATAPGLARVMGPARSAAAGALAGLATALEPTTLRGRMAWLLAGGVLLLSWFRP